VVEGDIFAGASTAGTGYVPIDQVSVLLGHSSVKITEKSYSPWVKARQEQLEGCRHEELAHSSSASLGDEQRNDRLNQSRLSGITRRPIPFHHSAARRQRGAHREAH
jgi:hypothetical protein